MTTEQHYILQILSSSLRNEAYSIPPPDTLDWDTFFSEAGKQGISALLYFNVDKTVLPEAVRAQFSDIAYKDLGASCRVIEAHAKVCKLLEENGIPAVILKGYASAHYYPHPEQRSMGDVDFYVEEEYRPRAREILQANGYVEEDVNRHHDWLYHKADLIYELHFAISGVPHGAEGEPFLRELDDVVTDRRWVQAKLGRIAIPSDYHHGLIILLHTASHLMAGGLGLRHLYDWAAFVNHFSDDEFQSVFRDKFEALRIWRFAQVLTGVCEKYLGLPNYSWTSDVSESAVDKLMAEFMETGDYSKDHGSRQADLMASEGFTVRVGHKSGIGNMLAVLRNSVEYRWPKTQKNKILLVLGMVYSAIRYFFRMLTGKREKLNLIEMNKEATERRELYREFGLE